MRTARRASRMNVGQVLECTWAGQARVSANASRDAAAGQGAEPRPSSMSYTTSRAARPSASIPPDDVIEMAGTCQGRCSRRRCSTVRPRKIRGCSSSPTRTTSRRAALPDAHPGHAARRSHGRSVRAAGHGRLCTCWLHHLVDDKIRALDRPVQPGYAAAAGRQGAIRWSALAKWRCGHSKPRRLRAAGNVTVKSDDVNGHLGVRVDRRASTPSKPACRNRSMSWSRKLDPWASTWN